MTEAAYDRIGIGYSAIRQPEPGIAARLEAALGEARTVLNVGAGTGSYEPAEREVTAVEPSLTMIRQRPPGSAPAVEAFAEELPFEDDSIDAAMAIITVHHWSKLPVGLAEMARVARRRAVVLSFDPAPVADLWLGEYFPGALDYHAGAMPPIDELTAGEIERGLEKLNADLESGRWDERHVTCARRRSWTSVCAWLRQSWTRRKGPGRAAVGPAAPGRGAGRSP
ncbi:MAG TPA: methyltransferase domain-containing protein [Solirubrobacterales bacterium]|nr:methyltransferase domain-containing protein [Solirubrobacterales bacterium]